MEPQAPPIAVDRRRGVFWVLYLAVVAAAIAPILVFISARRVPADHLGDFEGWRPTRAEVQDALGLGPSGSYTDTRHLRYVGMFKHRFRDQQFAVGMRFADQQTIEVMCAAMIPRWDMARVAMMAEEEADKLFAGRHRVRIYETYISTRAHQIGELNPLPNGRVSIDFGRIYPQQPMAPRRPGLHSIARGLPRPRFWSRPQARLP